MGGQDKTEMERRGRLQEDSSTRCDVSVVDKDDKVRKEMVVHLSYAFFVCALALFRKDMGGCWLGESGDGGRCCICK